MAGGLPFTRVRSSVRVSSVSRKPAIQHNLVHRGDLNDHTASLRYHKTFDAIGCACTNAVAAHTEY